MAYAEERHGGGLKRLVKDLLLRNEVTAKCDWYQSIHLSA